jgi:hypothetical protein
MSWRRVPKTSVLSCVLAVFSIASIGCSSMNSSPNRVLQSMTVSPATADAQTSPQGQVQFTATGTFSKPPSPGAVTFVAPYSGSWSSSNPNIATVSQSGVGVCVSGASGTVTVKAVASSNSATGTRMSTAVSGTAKLICP